MSFLIQKLPGAAKACFFLHEGKRVTPTALGIVLDSRPPEHAFTDPWLKVTEVDSTSAKKLRAEISEAEEVAKATASDRTKADDDAKVSRADLTASGIMARSTADLDRSLAQLRAERKAVEEGLAAKPARKASAQARMKAIDARIEKLLEAGAKSAKKAKEPKPVVAVEPKPAEKSAKGAKSAKKAKEPANDEKGAES